MRWPAFVAVLLLSAGCVQPGEDALVDHPDNASSLVQHGWPVDGSVPVAGLCEIFASAEAGAAGHPIDLRARQECSPDALRSASGGPFRSAVVEIEWGNGADALQDLRFRVRFGSRPATEHTATESPLRVVFGDGALPAGTLQSTVGFVAEGVLFDFRATVHVSAFEAPEPPAGYTALAFADPGEPLRKA